MKKIFQKLEIQNLSIFRNGVFEMSDLYLAQALAKVRSLKEFSSPVYLGWLGFEKFGWEYLGLFNLDVDLIVGDHSVHQEAAKEIKIQKAEDFADGVEFVCTMFEEVYNKYDISEYNAFLNTILKEGKLADGLEVGNGFKQAVLAALQVQNKFKNLTDYTAVKDLINTMTNNKAASKVLDSLNVYSIYKELKNAYKFETNREKLYAKCFKLIDDFVIPDTLFSSRVDAINSLNLNEVVAEYPVVETSSETQKSKFVELLVSSFLR